MNCEKCKKPVRFEKGYTIGLCSKCFRTHRQNKLFDLTNKHDSWEDLIEMLSDKELNNLIDNMKERNDILED